jgi:Cof subfamily protein (haloacid dehalogenase superfamily)
MLVTDLDGTLISEDDSISEVNLRALHQVRDMGLYIALCSGRDPKSISELALAAGLDDCSIIALNGAIALDRPFGETLEDHRISGSSAKACLDILLPQSGDLMAYLGETWSAMALSAKPRPTKNPAASPTPEENDIRQAFYQMASAGLHKLLYTEMDHPERLRPLRKKLSLVPGVDVTSSWFTNIEIMPKGIHKGFAVRRLAARLDVSMDQVLAFGDNDNDAPMLAQVGYGVAMGNAADAARSAARYTTDTSQRNGVAKGLERFILKQERPSA